MGRLKNIEDFRAKLINGGARSNLFEIQIPTLPDFVSSTINDAIETPEEGSKQKFSWKTAGKQGGLSSTFKFLCKAGQFPASNIGTVEIPFRGKVLKVGGDRVVDPWTVTVINDENNAIRSVMEVWMQQINSYDTAEGNSTISSAASSNIFTDAYIFQLDRTGKASKEKKSPVYHFYDIWPSNISEIALSYDSTDAVEEFTIEFQVHRWEEASGESGVYDKLNS